MSGKLNGAVYKSGPRTKARRTLLRLACNADHWGFAQMRVDTIARDVQIDERTVLRDIKELASEGWLHPVRKAVDGCGNVYFLNRAKLGVFEDPKGPKSPLHREFLDRVGAQWEGPRFAQPMVQNDETTGDNPQPPQVTKNARQVTPGADTGDKTPLPNKEAPWVLRFSVDTPSVEATTTAATGLFPEIVPAGFGTSWKDIRSAQEQASQDAPPAVRDRGGGLRRIA